MSDNSRQRLLLVGSLVVISGALFALYWTQFAGPRRDVLRPHTAIGQVMAEEVVQLVGASGQVVIVADELAKSPSMAAEVNAFKTSLHQKGNIKIAAIWICRIPNRAAYRGIPSGDFQNLLQRYPNVDVFVSFVGAPSLDERQIAGLPDKRPKLAAVCRVRSGLGRLMDGRVVQVAIVPRFVFPAPVTEPKTGREWFDKFYQVIRTPSELGTSP